MIKRTLKNFYAGYGSIMEIYPARTSKIQSDHISDTEKIRSDWVAIGNDMRKAMGRMDDEIKKTK